MGILRDRCLTMDEGYEYLTELRIWVLNNNLMTIIMIKKRIMNIRLYQINRKQILI